MILDMQGNLVEDLGPSTKNIEIQIDPRLEDERFEDFFNNYLIPFLKQLKVPVIKIVVDKR
jgi:hypothetical protein